MALRTIIIPLLLAATAGTASAARGRASEEALALFTAQAKELTEQTIDKETLIKLPKILNSAAALGISLITAFNEDDPDIEYALENLDLQGWQLVKLTIPKDLDNTDEMKAAKRAWDTAFEQLPDLVEKIQSAYKSGNKQAGMEVLLETMDLALGAAAKAVTAQAKYINAARDLIRGLGGAATKFTKDMGFLDDSSSLAQISDAQAEKKWDAARINAMLTTGVGLITTFISAGTEEPPDFQYAINSFKIQGWKLAKMAVPPEGVRSEKMKKAKKAWNQVFVDAPELAENAYAAYKNNDMDLTVKVVLGTVDKGLRTAATIDDDQATKFTAVADVIQSVSTSIMKFGHEVGWLQAGAF